MHTWYQAFLSFLYLFLGYLNWWYLPTSSKKNSFVSLEFVMKSWYKWLAIDFRKYFYEVLMYIWFWSAVYFWIKGIVHRVLHFFHFVSSISFILYSCPQIMGMSDILAGVFFPNMAAIILISVCWYSKNLVWNESYLSDHFFPAYEVF